MIKMTGFNRRNPQHFEPIKADPLNDSNRRNIRNSNKLSYNCGGYALGTFSWYCPYPPEYEGQSVSDIPLQVLIDTMLNDFKGRLRLIKDCKECKRGERVIAFRTSTWDDFHYMLRGRNGLWYHKMGNQEEIRRVSKKIVFSSNWFNYYYGEIVLFAMKY